MIAALFVDAAGCYANLPNVDPWSKARDARTYSGPYPVVAHPPCQRDDKGCFKAALAAVRRYGGVLEHPKDSHAWPWFGLPEPFVTGGWSPTGDDYDGWTCCVWQGHYGHFAGKPSWLYACGTDRPALSWGRTEQRLHPVAVERHGYEKARRIGMMAMVGGKNKTRVREATPIAFRDLLISIAESANKQLTLL